MINLFMNIDNLTMYAFITLFSFPFYFSRNIIFDEYDWESTKYFFDLYKIVIYNILNLLAIPVKVQVSYLNKIIYR